MTTTVSITRCFKSISLAACLLGLLACLLQAPRAHAQAPAAEVTQMRVERTDEAIQLSAAVKFDVFGVVEDALAKGIPMFFVAEASILQDRWYWYDKKVATATRFMRLSYQPLTRRWRLQVSAAPIGGAGLSLGQNFETREEALAAVQRISNWRIADAADIDADGRHSVEFRFRLDISQLPRPFQIGAVGQSEWNISASRTQRIETPPR